MAYYFKFCEGYEDKDLLLPERATSYSAGYDFFAGEDTVIPSIWSQIIKVFTTKSFEPTIVWTHVKAKMRDDDETLFLFNRSSNPARGLILANGVGVVDADYYENPANDGDIGFLFYNILPYSVVIKKGQKIGQGVFTLYSRVQDEEDLDKERTGGFGSTGE